MGAILSSEAVLENVSRLASRDVCDEETWGNTLRNRSTHTVHDHLEGLVSACEPERVAPTFIADAVCEEFSLIFTQAAPAVADPPLGFAAPASPSSSTSSLSELTSSLSSRRRRLEFAASNEVAFYSADAPPQEMFGRDQVQVL